MTRSHSLRPFAACLAASAALFAAGPGLAQTAVQTTADLNLRTGPGTNYEVATTMPSGAEAMLEGCLSAGDWCRVTYGGVSGWASSSYLTTSADGRTVVVSETHRSLPTIAADAVAGTVETGASVVGGAVGAVTGAVTGAVSGAASGATAGTAAVERPVVVDQYVERNPAQSVYVDREVTIGASLPPSVRLQPIPDYEYAYAAVNGRTVLVDPTDRRVVHVYR